MKDWLYSVWALLSLWVSGADEPTPPSSTRMAVAGGIGYAAFIILITVLLWWAL